MQLASCPCFTADALDILGVDYFGDFGPTGIAVRKTLIDWIDSETYSYRRAAVGTDFNGTRFCYYEPGDRRTEVYSATEVFGISPAEAEACRVLIYEEANDRSLPCNGQFCGQPYTAP